MALIFKLQDDHLQDLLPINKLTPENLDELCKLSMEFIVSGNVKKAVQQVAVNLTLERDEVEKIVTSLSYLFSDCARAKLTPDQFHLTTLDIPSLPESHSSILIKYYETNSTQLRSLYEKVNSTESCFGITTIPQYKDLEWRFEMECDRKSVRQILDPYFTLKLITTTTIENEKKTQAQYFNTSYHELKHIHDVLGEALKEMKSKHTKRMRHYIK
ncbi:hypothetical protein ABK040_003562 [Willaertia magna]